MVYTIVNLGNYETDHVYQLLVDDALNTEEILQKLTEFYYHRYYQQLVAADQFNHDLNRYQGQIADLQHLADTLAPKIEHWSALEQSAKGQYSASISQQYNHQLRRMWVKFQKSPIIRYDNQHLRDDSKLFWKTFGYHVQTAVKIIDGLKNNPEQALRNYAQVSFNLPKMLAQRSNHWSDFIEACDNPLITETTVQVIPTQEVIQQVDYHLNDDPNHAPTVEVYDPYDYCWL